MWPNPEARQELVFIGDQLVPDALVARFDRALLTDEEMDAGLEAWQAHPDPLPAWAVEDQDALAASEISPPPRTN